MPKIFKLSDDLIAQVAAGEVIAEPSDVVKELIENALDAQATQICIYLKEGGTKSIRVIDNGIGMSPEDILESWKHHTTSKLKNSEDLYCLNTFGFRGEALSSMAAVADLTISSRTKKSEKGQEIQIIGQKKLSDQPVGMPIGTKVQVDNLFRDVPARRARRVSPRTLLAHTEQVIIQEALVHPEVRFELHHNDTSLLILSKTQAPRDRLPILWGEQNQHILPVNWETPHLRIHGFLGKPQLARRNRSQQYVSINKRPVVHPELAKTIRQAFNTLLEPHLHPSFALFLEAPADTVDPNIHPRKREVRLLRSDNWQEQFLLHIQELLAQYDVSYRHGENWSVADSSPQTVEGTILKDIVDAWQVRPPQETSEILQAHKLYLILPTLRGVLLVAQHAAHERILYEQFKSAWEQELSSPKHIFLDTPITLQLSNRDHHNFHDHQKTLETLGFQFATTDPKASDLQVLAVPELYSDRDVAILLTQVLDDLEEGPLGRSLHPNQHRLLAYLACRTAIKAGESLTLEERQKLITKLLHTKTRYTCPHGRPVMIELSLDELEKLFKRG